MSKTLRDPNREPALLRGQLAGLRVPGRGVVVEVDGISTVDDAPSERYVGVLAEYESLTPYVDGENVIACPNGWWRRETSPADLAVVFSGAAVFAGDAATTQFVPFSPALSFVPEVFATVKTEGGTPVAGITATISAITRYGFKCVLSAEPGADNSVRVRFSFRRPANPITVPTVETLKASGLRATPASGGPRMPTNSWLALNIRILNAASARYNNVLWCSVGGNAGFYIYANSGAVLGCQFGSAAVGVNPVAFTAADNDKDLLIVLTWDGTTIKTYAPNAEGVMVLAGSGAATYTGPSTSRFGLLSQIGNEAGTYADNFAVRAVRAGLGVPTIQDIQAFADHAKRNDGELRGMAGVSVTNTHNYVLDGSATVVNKIAPGTVADQITTISGTVAVLKAGFNPQW